MSLFDGFDWGGFAAGALTAIPGIYAANRGAAIQRQGNEQAANIARATSQDQINQIRGANERAIAQFRPILAESPQTLTPAQNVTLQDTQRDLNNSNLLGRMGGRAFTKGFADVNNRFRAGAVAENTRRQDAARSGISAIERGAGPQIAGPIGTAGQATADATLGNAGVQADTVGAISNYFANAVKEGDRERRYKEYSKGV